MNDPKQSLTEEGADQKDLRLKKSVDEAPDENSSSEISSSVGLKRTPRLSNDNEVKVKSGIEK